MDRSYLSQVERGHVSVSIETLGNIAQGFNLKLWELLEGL
jgi:transcriptional regulator with XRE-family HTH domain